MLAPERVTPYMGAQVREKIGAGRQNAVFYGPGRATDGGVRVPGLEALSHQDRAVVHLHQQPPAVAAAGDHATILDRSHEVSKLVQRLIRASSLRVEAVGRRL